VAGLCPKPVRAQEVKLSDEKVASVNADGGQLRVEPSVVLADSVVVVAWNDSRAGREYGVRVGVGIAWSYSVNGGRSFRFGGYLPDPATERLVSPSGADSWLDYDGRGTVYLQFLHWPDEGDHEIRVYALSTERPERFELRGIAATGPGLDKPAMAVGPDGTLRVVYTADGRIFEVASADGGRSWSEPVLLSQDTSGVTRSGVDVVACGGRIVAVWVEEGSQAAESPGGVWTAEADRAGAEFGPPRRIYPLAAPLPVPPGYALGLGPMSRIPNNAFLACRPTDGGDRLTLTFAAPTGSGDDGETAVRSRAAYLSAAAGEGPLHWQEAAPASDGTGRFQAFPTLAATSYGVASAWYDWRNAEHAVGTDVYFALRRDEGVAEFRLTDVPTAWTRVPGDPQHAVVQRNVGDYISMDGEGRRWVVAWTDGRSGRSEIRVRVIELR
jgi:hypothetical protein